MNNIYQKQVALLLKVLPEVAKETCFALYGGTAINLFVRDMPRLSIDIDLTYIPIEPREISIEEINYALDRIKLQLEKILPTTQIEHKVRIAKLLISLDGVGIKIEVNTVGRGIIGAVEKLTLCNRAQAEYNAFVRVPVMPIGQLFGGKICAALDRQHPRDLFDVKYLLAEEGISDHVKTGFMLNLISCDRPIHELLHPNQIDMRAAMDNQFYGMTNDNFTYQDYEHTRNTLVKEIHSLLTPNDKSFLLSVKNTEPDWSIYDFQHFPSVQWKLINLGKLKTQNKSKHAQQYSNLRKVLETTF